MSSVGRTVAVPITCRAAVPGTSLGIQTDASVAALSDGGFVVTWTDDAKDGSAQGIFAQRFDASGIRPQSSYQNRTGVEREAINMEIQGSAADLIKHATAALGGQGGGGRPDMAQGGGPDGSRAQAAIEAVRAAL